MEEFKIPSLGLGTFRISGENIESIIDIAIESGYAMIDCAPVYNNEKEIGLALKNNGILRKDIFLTSKVPNEVSSFDEVIKSFEKSCIDLGVDVIDLYLIHWPSDKKRNIDVWQGLEHLYKENKVRAIGVCNFNVNHIDDLLEEAEIVPMINQVELNVNLQQIRLQEYCNEMGIALMGYGSLADITVLENPAIKKIASKHNKSIVQVILRWAYQRGVIMLSKASSQLHLEENIDIQDFKLSMDEMEIIKSLSNGKRSYPDPENYLI